jgi:hypothetical protein
MDDGGSASTLSQFADVPWGESVLPSGRWSPAYASSALTSREISWAPAPSAPDSSALPGEALTEAVANNLADRRVLLRIFRKLAKSGCIGASATHR